MEYKKYVYSGGIMEFDKCIEHKWSGVTYATSLGAARRNLEYQYKKATGRVANTNIKLAESPQLIE